jgi:hypothetical protein
MEDQEKLFGEYLGFTKRIFTRKEILDIRQDIIDGVLIERISARFNVSMSVIRSLFSEFIQTMDSLKTLGSTAKLGHKNTSYNTEEEMLGGLPQYTWKEVSKEEKQFYINKQRNGKRSNFNKSHRDSSVSGPLE